jgi:hypothetical protein
MDRRAAVVLLVLSATALLVACGRSNSSGRGPDVGGPALAVSTSSGPGGEPLDGQLAELWGRAKEGEADDLARLADREGAPGLVDRGKGEPALRPTALRALAYVHDFTALPWLASVARGDNDADALSALDSVMTLASAPRRALDPEDAQELREGCDTLLALARDPGAARARRVQTIRALRMLTDRGCVKPTDIPSDLDVH